MQYYYKKREHSPDWNEGLSRKPNLSINILSLGHQVGHQSCVAKLGGQVQAATPLTIPTQRFGMVIKVLLSPGHQIGHQSCVAKLGG
jgi:hypothetical protein